jgi:hypothetical protein
MLLFCRFFVVSLFVVCGVSYGQVQDNAPPDTLSLEERLDIFRDALQLDFTQQALFEKTYISYHQEQRAFRCSFLTLDNLAKIAGGLNQAEALDCLHTLLVDSDDDARTRDRYFEFIKREIDPKTADQFMKLELGFEKTYINLLRRRVLAIDLPHDKNSIKSELLAVIGKLGQS